MHNADPEAVDQEALYLQQQVGASGRDVLAESVRADHFLDADLLAKALAAALKHRPNQAPLVLTQAAVAAYETARRHGKLSKIEDLVKALLD